MPDRPDWPADWLEDFVDAEEYLLEHADWRTNTPSELPVVDAPQDHVKAQALVAWLVERGWRVAVGEDGALAFYSPGPLSDPGDEARLTN